LEAVLLCDRIEIGRGNVSTHVESPALYRLRYKVERTFGWQDIYRKLAVSDDRLPEIRKGGRLLAYSMINFRVTFHTS
jgi:transposase